MPDHDMTPEAMTPEDMAAFAARHGLTAITPDQLERMRALSVKVAATGRAVPRMALKSDEPAGVFRVPLPSRT